MDHYKILVLFSDEEHQKAFEKGGNKAALGDNIIKTLTFEKF
jgi:hypothetical protein